MGCPSMVHIDDNLVFSVCTHDPDTGALTDADAAPIYRIYEEETAAAILTGTMAKLDDANTTGFYTELIACTAANGFEAGKSYTVYIEATVDSDTGGISYGFKAETDIADAVWDELSTGHTGAGKAGAQLWTDVDTILTDTDELQADWANGGRLDLLIDAILADTGSLNDTVLSEIAGASDIPATPTLRQALMLLYMMARNDSRATATERRVLNDAGIEVLDATMSDDGTSFSQGKLGDA